MATKKWINKKQDVLYKFETKNQSFLKCIIIICVCVKKVIDTSCCDSSNRKTELGWTFI